MLEFAWPWLFLLLPLPLLIYLVAPAAQGNSQALRLPSYQHLQLGDSAQPQRGNWWPLLAGIWLLLLTAAARPYWLGDPVTQPTQGRDLMLAVDLSGSMEIKDMRWNDRLVDRLKATKLVLGEFIQRRVGDRLGLILFADAAYLQAPLTFDRATVATLLDETVIGLVGEATAIGDALGLAIKRLLENNNEQKVVILLTDGQNTAGDVAPLEAAKLAAELGITIYTIGIGADEMYQRSLFGTQKINPSRDLDERSLREIARLTGGRYYRARDPGELAEIYQTLDQLEPIDYDAPSLRPRQSLFHWPLGAALLLSLLPLGARLLQQSRTGWQAGRASE